jgi:hypothetical protein
VAAFGWSLRGLGALEVWEPAGFYLSNAKRLRFGNIAIVRFMCYAESVFVFFQPSRFKALIGVL